MGQLALIGSSFDASALTPEADGSLRVPAWMRVECATSGRTAQTGPSTLATGLGANVLRAFSVDGVEWAGLVEPAGENLVTEPTDFSTTWLDFFTPATASVTGPDGSSGVYSVADDNASGTERKYIDAGALSASTMSMSSWIQRVTVTGSSDVRLALSENANLTGGQLNVDVTSDDAEWSLRSVSGAVAAIATSYVSAVPALGSNVDTGTAYFFGVQLEARAYPTSFIDGTREADRVPFATEVAYPDRLAGEMRWRPLYAHDEATGEHTILRLADDLHVRYHADSERLVATIGGETIATEPLDHARLAALSLEYDFDAVPRKLRLSGPASGGGIYLGDVEGELAWTATRGADGTVELAPWMSYDAPTAGRSAQQTAATLVTGYGEDVARWFSRDGSMGGFLLEPGAVNLVTDQDLSGAGWSSLGTPVVTGAISDPAGGASAYRINDNDGAAVEHRFRGATYPAGAMTLSSWARHDGGTGAGVLREGATGGAGLSVPIPADATAWARYVDSTASHPGGADQVVLSPRSVSADTGAVDFYGVQLEAGLYPTSFIDGTRAADSLAIDGTRVAPQGYVDVEITFAPLFASDEVSGTVYLLYSDPDNHLAYDASAGTWDWTVQGTTISSSACTFSRDQVMTLHGRALTTAQSLVVEGSTGGDGTTVGPSAGRFAGGTLYVAGDDSGTAEAFALASMTWRSPGITRAATPELDTFGYILSGPSGAEEGAVLDAFVPDVETMCELAESRVLAQMSDDPRNFRDLICILSEQPGEFRDVALRMIDSFEVETAVGDQLDIIGSIVGLPREGFLDDRYRAFIKIQTQLLLAVARQDAEWTGTVENILRIARTFIGDDPSPVVLRNLPPYNYTLGVPGLQLGGTPNEVALLVRFLRTASYAGVLGYLMIKLADASTWGSASVSLPSAGKWGSANVAITGAAKWGTVVTTA